MPDQAKNIAIGLFVVAACAIVVFIILFLHPATGDEAKVFHVRFSDIDKVNVGTRVTFAGKAVGEVKEIQEVKNSRTDYVDNEGNVYPYELTLVVDSGIDIYSTDVIMLRTSGLLGERSVSIIPVAPAKGTASKLMTKDDIIYAAIPPSLEETMSNFKTLTHKAEETLDGVISILDDLKREGLWDNISNTAKNINEITTVLNQPEKWNDMLAHFDEFSRHADHFGEKLLKSWVTVDKVLANVDTTTDNAMVITNKVRKGEGTAGKILVGDDLYLRFVSILNKIETIGDDINHYGLLFQTDKGWQRLRARRMNMLAKLSSPQEFRNYFNDEVNQISTSLSRVSTILDKTDLNSQYYPLAEDKEFTKVFSELLRRISGIEEELRMYNSQVMDSEIKKTEFVNPGSMSESSSISMPGQKFGCIY